MLEVVKRNCIIQVIQVYQELQWDWGNDIILEICRFRIFRKKWDARNFQIQHLLWCRMGWSIWQDQDPPLVKIASAWVYAGVSQEVSEWVVIKAAGSAGSLENCTPVDFRTVIKWVHERVKNGLYWGCNPLTSLWLSSCDIQVGLAGSQKDGVAHHVGIEHHKLDMFCLPVTSWMLWLLVWHFYTAGGNLKLK